MSIENRVLYGSVHFVFISRGAALPIIRNVPPVLGPPSWGTLIYSLANATWLLHTYKFEGSGETRRESAFCTSLHILPTNSSGDDEEGGRCGIRERYTTGYWVALVISCLSTYAALRMTMKVMN